MLIQIRQSLWKSKNWNRLHLCCIPKAPTSIMQTFKFTAVCHTNIPLFSYQNPLHVSNFPTFPGAHIPSIGTLSLLLSLPVAGDVSRYILSPLPAAHSQGGRLQKGMKLQIRSLCNSKTLGRTQSPERAGGPQCRPVPRRFRRQQETLRQTSFPRKPRQFIALPLPRHLTAAAMLTIPDGVDEIAPTLQFERDFERVPFRNWQRGKGLEAARGKGREPKQAFLPTGEGAGRLCLVAVLRSVLRAAQDRVFRGSGTTA